MEELRPAGRGTGAAAAKAPRIVRRKRIWQQAAHNAFTDLARFGETWYCAFREAQAHAGCDGRVRVLVSPDGEAWRSATLLAAPGADLRDPKLSVTPDGRLMLLAGSAVRREGRYAAGRPLVFFSEDGRRWTAPRGILAEGEWLWRVTWQAGRAYGVSYRARENGEWSLTLLDSGDGLEYRPLCGLAVPGRPNETTLRFLADGRMVALVRREGGDCCGWVGVSRPPYRDWEWQQTRHRLGGPNFLALPDGRLWAAGRGCREGRLCTVLARLEPGSAQPYEPVLELPGGGDCSYPGLVWHGGLLWVSYYASRGAPGKGRTAVYLAQVRLA